MKHFLRYCLLFLIVMASHASFAVPNNATCGDFLGAINKKPEHLEFVKCEPGFSAQVRTLEATYRVQGQHADSVEKYFIRHAGMRKLKFYCCGWEPTIPVKMQGSAHIKVDKETVYDISMGAETPMSRRSGWSKIPWFYVNVTLDLEEP